jgi:hypothetical protein
VLTEELAQLAHCLRVATSLWSHFGSPLIVPRFELHAQVALARHAGQDRHSVPKWLTAVSSRREQPWPVLGCGESSYRLADMLMPSAASAGSAAPDVAARPIWLYGSKIP